jgi:uroporphyrinogen decarboxylase
VTKRQRLAATLRREPADRTPFCLWMHSTVRERTVERFTRFTLDFYRAHDPDFIKVMYDESYDLPVNYQYVTEPQVWRLLEEFEPDIGGFGRQVEALKRVREEAGPEVPVIQTIYSPFHVGRRLAGRRILEDWQTDPEAVRYGLNTIAANYRRFAERCRVEAGVDGFFFAPQGCEASWMSPEQYRAMVMPSDRAVLEALRPAPVLILHIHGEKDVFFDLLSDYPCDAISWEDRLAGPSIAEARMRTGRCLMGGIDHYAARTCPPEQVLSQARDALTQAGGRGFILAPGCTFFNDTPVENLRALKAAVC